MAKQSWNYGTAERDPANAKGMEGREYRMMENVDSKEKKLPFPETWTVKQGTTNPEMILEPPYEGKDTDFLGPDYTNENKNPNNEAFQKTKQPKGANPKGMGLGEIDKLAGTNSRE